MKIKKKNNQLYFTISNIILEVVDYLALLFIFYSSYKFLLFFSVNITYESKIIFSLPLLCLIIMAYTGIYSKRLNFWDESKQIVKSILVSSFVIIWLMLTIGIKFPYIVHILMFSAIASILLPSVKYILKLLFYRLGLWKENVLIVGAGKASLAASKAIAGDQYIGYNVIGYVDDRHKTGLRILNINGRDRKVLSSLKNVVKIIKMMKIDTVYIAIPTLEEDRLSDLTKQVQKYVKHIFVIPQIKGLPQLNTMLYYFFFEDLFLLHIKNNFRSYSNKILKILVDIILCILISPILIPLIFVLAVLIKIDSSGPIFYSHERVGKHGKKINVYKFRSMYRDSKERLEEILATDPEAKEEWNKNYKLKNDPRVTKIGSFLRKTSLDELPQIFNVFKGEMSFVGPRPVLQDEIDKYYKDYKQYYYMVKPGITGLWQVSGRSNTDYDVRVKLDTMYVVNWSAWLDITTLIKTIKAVLAQDGAY